MGGSSLGVGMIGYSFMGAVHSHAWRTVGRVFDLVLTEVLEDHAPVEHLPNLHGVVGGAQAVVRVTPQNLAVREADLSVSHDICRGTGLEQLADDALHQIRHRVRLTRTGLAVR